MKKKAMSVALCLSMLLGLLPPLFVSARAAGTVSYRPVTTEWAILNRFNYNNSDFYTAYVKNTGLYNAVSKFGLSAETTYIRSSGTYAWNNFLTDDSNQLTNYGILTNSGQLKVGMSATLRNVLHRHGSKLYGADSLAYQYAVLYSGYGNQTLNGYVFGAAGTATQRMGDMEYIPVRVSDKMELLTGVGRTYQYCNCGDCSIGDFAVAFADTQDPSVSRVYPCDANGVALNRIPAGSALYLCVVFDEPIRFADNSSAHGDVTVTMQDGNDNRFTGNLVSLEKDDLMFEFDIPADVTGNLTMSSVDLSALFGNGNWNMVLVQNGASMNGQINTAAFSGSAYTTSTSLITDVAGNPLRSPSASNAAALSSACYIDGEAPYVEEVSKTAVMNNSDVKEALGGAENDQSDTHAGLGDSVTFTASFNEQLKINGNCSSSSDFWGMKATLNVKDSEGNCVTVRSASMSQVSGGTNKQNGASQGRITAVTFEPFIPAAGMTCDDADGKIKIISVTSFNDQVSITDLCGNPYADTGNDWNTLNANPFFLDVTAPFVTVKEGEGATENENGAYTPAEEASSGTTVTAFCLPLNIADSSGVNGLSGSFSWVNRESEGADYGFQYAVTADSTVPAESKWTNGETGKKYSFTQVETGTYIHIRLFDNLEYDLTDTSINVTAKDYAGNSGMTSLHLDYAADGIAPVAVLSGVNRVYDDGTSTGELTVDVTVTDKVGIIGIGSLWITDGSVPGEDDPGWTPIGSFASGDKTALASAVRSGITAVEPFTGTLYIKADDPAGNTSITEVGAFAYDLSKPDYSVGYTDAGTAEAALSISDLETDSAVAVMVKTPDAPDTCYVSVIDSSDHFGDVLNNTEFTGLSYNNLYNWRKYTVRENAGVYSFTYLGGCDDYLLQIIHGFYYGKLDVTILSGSASTSTMEFTSESGTKENGAFLYETVDGITRLVTIGTDAYPVYAETVTLNAAAGTVHYAAADSASGYAGYYGGGEEIHTAEITSMDQLNNRLTSRSTQPKAAPAFDPDSSADDILSTLEGVSFTVNLSNKIVSGWGIDDVDFEDTYLKVIRYYNENDNYTNEQIGGNIYLVPAHVQTITLPAFDYPSGTYKIVLTVTSKAGGQVQTFEYGESICVDATPASASFGFAGVSTSMRNNNYGLAQTSYTCYGPFYVDENGSNG